MSVYNEVRFFAEILGFLRNFFPHIGDLFVF